METAGPNLAAEPVIMYYATAGRSRTALPAVLLSGSPVSERIVIRYIEIDFIASILCVIAN
jgi:hypothetical protein